ncbi:hypothetical protein [Pseudomarimonas arenosa]|uniref:Anti-sigma factor n=1 Tax=Pseudomarimonas arenosa TaxID=2774145 RepID=A0AAW3ZNJ8_9GAMM|nr:hypothetical protein [Pseudomarimonas arenosa]MBD8525861.1 hypothetical protein [Pseudomarimonas arenosa]
MFASRTPLSPQDNAAIRAWRRGEMNESEAEAFETRLFLEPELLEAAKLDQQIEHGLRAAGNDLLKVKSQPNRLIRQALPLALAAGLGALAVLPLSALLQKGPESHANVEWVSLDVRRGIADLPLIAPRADTELVALEIGAPSDAPRFDVELRDRRSQDLLLSFEALTASDGLISLAFARDALTNGEYRVRVFEQGRRDQAGLELSFRYQP